MQNACAVFYCDLCGLSDSTILFHVVVINGMIFWKRVLNGKCLFWICLQFLCEEFLILRRIQRDTIINVSVNRFNNRISNFYENPSSGSRVIPCEETDLRTDRRTAMTNLIAFFLNYTSTLKNWVSLSCINAECPLERKTYCFFKEVFTHHSENYTEFLETLLSKI